MQPSSALDILLVDDDAMNRDALARRHAPRFIRVKGSAVLENARTRDALTYSALCGRVLARAHARTGDGAAIGAYLGKSDVFDAAVTDFAVAYADQTERDHRAFVKALEA